MFDENEKLTASGAAKPSMDAVADAGGSNIVGSERSQVDVDGVFVVTVTVAEPSVPDVGVIHVVRVGAYVVADAGVGSNDATEKVATALTRVMATATEMSRRNVRTICITVTLLGCNWFNPGRPGLGATAGILQPQLGPWIASLVVASSRSPIGNSPWPSGDRRQRRLLGRWYFG